MVNLFVFRIVVQLGLLTALLFYFSNKCVVLAVISFIICNLMPDFYCLLNFTNKSWCYQQILLLLGTIYNYNHKAQWCVWTELLLDGLISTFTHKFSITFYSYTFIYVFIFPFTVRRGEKRVDIKFFLIHNWLLNILNYYKVYCIISFQTQLELSLI